jgi:hypothetical protein
MRAITSAPGAREPSGSARELVGVPKQSAARSTVVSRRPAVATAAPARAEPSWRKVLATTFKLWFLRRLAGWRWRPAAVVMSLALGAGAVLLVTGNVSPAARVLPASGPPAGRSGSRAAASGPAAAARSQAAAWIASQVGGMAIIACDPAMCAALQAAGVLAGRLMPLRPGVADPAGAGVLVTSVPVSGQFADEYAPALIASFGSGAVRVDVRAIEAGGAVAYQAGLRADLATRQSAGSELLRNWHLTFTAQEASQLRAGEVDARVLATLAALASQYSFRVTSFGDASPGTQLPYRGVTISGRRQDLAAAATMVREQPQPYLPAYTALVPSAGLSIEFAAPSPLGLLTAVLTAAHSALPPTR